MVCARVGILGRVFCSNVHKVRAWDMQMGRWRAFGMVVLFGAVLVGACTSTKPTDVPLPDPLSVLTKAAAEVRGAKALKMKLQLTGAPSYVDPPQTPGGIGNNIAFVSANG